MLLGRSSKHANLSAIKSGMARDRTSSASWSWTTRAQRRLSSTRFFEVAARTYRRRCAFHWENRAAAAFVTTAEDPEINQPTIDYVAAFVPEATGKKFNPHVTIGVAPQDYLKEMLAELFDVFTFSPASASVYQLGNFGTARKELKALNPWSPSRKSAEQGPPHRWTLFPRRNDQSAGLDRIAGRVVAVTMSALGH